MFGKRTSLLLLVAFVGAVLSVQAFASENQGAYDRITLSAMSEGIALDVRVLKPDGFEGPRPTLVFVVGSGKGSTVANYSRFTEFFLEAGLAELGFALVYFDKRGLEGSEGVWYTADFEIRAQDTKNVALAVRELDVVDSDRLVVVGHSQGGWITQMVLADYPEVFAGGVSMAGPTFGVRRQLVNDYMSQYQCQNGLDEAESLQRASRRVQRELWLVRVVGWWGNLRQLNVIRDFEAAPYLQRIEQPLFLMFGEHDPLVSSSWSLNALDNLFGGQIPDHIEYYVGVGQGHTFREAPVCFDGNWSERPYSDATRQALVRWLARFAD
ncbi:MAG: alpha/beta fold hydrolase [Idiomarina sp.]|nr:alpha/beta fold hydrolase [Idiomarina sp.]